MLVTLSPAHIGLIYSDQNSMFFASHLRLSFWDQFGWEYYVPLEPCYVYLPMKLKKNYFWCAWLTVYATAMKMQSRVVNYRKCAYSFTGFPYTAVRIDRQTL